MQLFTKNIWRKAKYYVILQPIKNFLKEREIYGKKTHDSSRSHSR